MRIGLEPLQLLWASAPATTPADLLRPAAGIRQRRLPAAGGRRVRGDPGRPNTAAAGMRPPSAWRSVHHSW